MMNITWRTSVGVSCFHAAELVRRGRTLRDPALQQALDEPVEILNRAVEEERLPQEVFWRQVVPLSAEFATPRQLAQVVLTKLQGALEARVRIPRFERHLHEVRSAFLRARPKLAESLPALPGPMQPRWHQQGLGLLAGVPGWTDPEILVAQATVYVVPDFAGGAGEAHLEHNSARIEADDDSDRELPEMLRLAWLLSQLHLDVPRFSENIPRARLPLIAALAMAPVLLAVAEGIRLLEPHEDTLARALRLWMPPSERLEAWTTTVAQWWETYTGRRPSWGAALQALDRLLEE
jgi:hypothetical protein